MNIKQGIFALSLLLTSYICAHDLVEITDIPKDIKYATCQNFMNEQIYSCEKAYVHKDVLEKLKEVQEELKQVGYSLQILDAYRPEALECKICAAAPKERVFTGNPIEENSHSRGIAVDVTLVKLDGSAVEMPSEYDDFTDKSCRNCPTTSQEAKKHSEILEKAMTKYGFICFENDHWHFQLPDAEKYKILNVDFEELSK
jgi:zinc D-Ala-D-Ala dipeptidase